MRPYLADYEQHIAQATRERDRGLEPTPADRIENIARRGIIFLRMTPTARPTRGALLFEMEDVLRDARTRRVTARLPDDEGEITGD